MSRPRGRKNNATLLKEAEVAKCLKLCEGHAALEAPKIVVAMAEKAKQGDVAAAKLILDRIYPARRQVDDIALTAFVCLAAGFLIACASSSTTLRHGCCFIHEMRMAVA